MNVREAVRVHVTLEGTLQGIGFRPFVYRTARKLGLAGWIMNRADGVVIEAEGTVESIDRFVEQIRSVGPPGARLDRMDLTSIPPLGEVEFTIRNSGDQSSRHLPVAPDMATCAECFAELFDFTNRRYRYPWLSCARCGPRFSMLTGIPYDRAQTTMARFTLCEACRSEYDDPTDRRFHAESTACADCGPGIAFWKHDGPPISDTSEALGLACGMIRTGGIVAVKGIGGFHLWVDATSEGAVSRLRELKRRPHKPFAVMFPNLDMIRQTCELSDADSTWLTSPQAPIVILGKLEGACLAQSVGPGHSTVGAMLPYTPLHHLMMKELRTPVVATSGNRSEEPLVTDEQDAMHRLGTIADAFLIHNRHIARPVDDSVMRSSRFGPIILRRARGWAPQTIRLRGGRVDHGNGPVLGVGGQLKNTIALLESDRVLLSQHLGDLGTVEAERAAHQAVDDLQWLLRVTPRAVACDLHPDYRSTQLAQKLAVRWNIPLVRVQHHHAHVASCMAERQVTGEVLGVAWDGAGYGTDETMWGGEFLVGTIGDFRRVAHLRPFLLPGGEQAIRNPRRTELAIRRDAFGIERVRRESVGESREEDHLILAILENGFHAPATTSMGRLFDAVASMLNLCRVTTFEGQAAMALEQEASRSCDEDRALYPISLIAQAEDSPRWQADWRPMIEDITKDLHRGVVPSRIAHRFHRSLAELIGQIAELVGNEQVVLTGGCFQNALLLDLASDRLVSSGFTVLTHRQVPPNDGGLSLGQAVMAAALPIINRGSNDVPRSTGTGHDDSK